MNKPPYILQQPWNAVCNLCKDPYSFHGFYSCECTNSSCKNFSKVHSKCVNEYIEHLDKLAKEAEERSKKAAIKSYVPLAYKPTVDDRDLEEENEAQRLAYGMYTIPNANDPDDFKLDLTNAYDPDGFYSSCLDNDPSDDPADNQPIPVVFQDDDYTNLFGPLKI